MYPCAIYATNSPISSAICVARLSFRMWPLASATTVRYWGHRGAEEGYTQQDTRCL